MMKKIFSLVLILTAFSAVQAQTAQRHKIAIFTPLYLDSAFDVSGNYRFDKAFPKYLIPGLEFYQGAQLALDSLQKRGAPLDVFIYDSRSRRMGVAQQAAGEMDGAELVIAQSNVSETKLLADAALRRKVPFISATLPNDAGVTNNPYFVVLNSTLQTHIEGMYRFMQKYHSLDKITVFRKSGTQEDQIRDFLVDFGKATASVPLKIQFAEVGSNPTPETISRYLDSTKKNICIAGSLDEGFGASLSQSLASLKNTYPLTIFGMPTWDNFNFNKAEFNNVEIVYSTPFYYTNTTSPLATRITADFNNRMSNKPSDMFYRGYETTLRFALLLLDTKKDVASNLTRKGSSIFTGFDIQPVFKDRSSPELDYFENKKLYFIKVIGGSKNILY
jgi:hypothetical protein